MKSSRYRRTFCLHSGLILILAMSSAQAGVYRCKDASGATTYSQTPCKAGETSQSMNHVQHSSDPSMTQACDAAKRFAGIVYEKFQAGMPPENVIDEYGGVNYINSAALNIINYVGTFRQQTDTPVYQVSKLTGSKCRNGGFGHFAASDLPLPEDTMPTGMSPQQTPVMQATPQQPRDSTTAPPTPTTAPNEKTIQQLEQYLDQLKAQQKQHP